MPDLHDSIHLDMYGRFKQSVSWPRRLARAARAAKRELFSPDLYGLEWGDPDNILPLRYVRDHFIRPYVRRDHHAVEIGVGGGRWTQYLLRFEKLYLVDYYDELLREVRKTFDQPNMTFIKNNGTDFPGIPANSIDFLFTFGTFVHLDLHLIEGYLKNIRNILKPGGNAVIQYADQNKALAQQNAGFSDNTPDKMRHMVKSAGYEILEEDTGTMWHSSIVRFTMR